jgi:hypothetical protein
MSLLRHDLIALVADGIWLDPPTTLFFQMMYRMIVECDDWLLEGRAKPPPCPPCGPSVEECLKNHSPVAVSDAQLGKQIGNSMSVCVLERIFVRLYRLCPLEAIHNFTVVSVRSQV